MIIEEVNPQYSNDYINHAALQITDHLMPVDFDGDVDGTNNATNALNVIGGIRDHRPVVYFSIEETGSGSDNGFYYIGYYFYHPVDGGIQVSGYATNGHNHDLEGIFLIVRKVPNLPYGEAIMSLTQAHGAMLPYFFPGRVDPTATQSLVDGIGAWAGQIESWYDPRFGVNRPVAAVRTSTHGTYMAQDCNSLTSSYFYDSYGAYIPNSTSCSTACIHSQESWILYLPGITDNVADLPESASNGAWEYRLQEVASSPMWSTKDVYGGLFTGTRYTLEYGYNIAFDSFNPGGADPMWAWSGGPGIADGPPGHHGYWYSFAMDNTWDVHFEAGQWPTWTSYGELLLDSHSVAYTYFKRYSDPQGNALARFLNLPVAYNGYRPTPPPPPNGFSAGIDGPTVVESGISNTFTATVSGGTAPYTYYWGGLLRGTASSVTGSITWDGDLGLTVTDATGYKLAVSVHVRVACQNGTPC